VNQSCIFAFTLDLTTAVIFVDHWGALLARHIIDFTAHAAAVPEDVHEEARARFQEVAEGLGGIPPDSVFWNSVRDTQLCLVVRGWSFFYNVDAETLSIVEARKR
jgi:hypothetical protein